MIRHVQIALCLILTLAACEDPFSPTVENLAGTYHATILKATDSTGHTTDYLAIGSGITLELNAAGTVSGHLLIVGGSDDPGGGDLEADMTGTWTLAGDSVTFDQAADTFVRDWVFKAKRDQLSGSYVGANESATVVFTRQR